MGLDFLKKKFWPAFVKVRYFQKTRQTIYDLTSFWKYLTNNYNTEYFKLFSDVDDDPDEIVEVPVPPKPVPEVVNLENDEGKNSVISPAVTVAVMAPNENHSPSSSTVSQK